MTWSLEKQPRVGDIFGELTAINVKLGERGGVVSITCRCSCGQLCTPLPGSLVYGKTTRCPNCARRSTPAKRARFPYEFAPEPHRSRLLLRITSCIGRCHRHPHPDYGARGISVWPLWRENRASFLRYLVSIPGWDNPDLEMDRINNEQGYIPGNIRFTTKSVNMSNTRRHHTDSKGTIALCKSCRNSFVRLRRGQKFCGHQCGICGQPKRLLDIR
jgi:hypothetical protein